MAGAEAPRDDALAAPTELDRLRAELAASREQFRSIIQRNADGIVVVDETGEIRFANHAAERLFGRDASALLGSPFGHPLVTGETTEIDIVRSGDRVVAELRVMDTEWEGELARLVSLRDVTDRKQAEGRSRRLLREQVARAEAEEAAWRAGVLAEAGRRLSGTLDLRTILQDTASIVVEKLGDFCVVHLVDGDRVQQFVAARDPAVRHALSGDAARDPHVLDGDNPIAATYRDRGARLLKPVPESWLRAAAPDRDRYDALGSLRPAAVILAPLFAGHDCFGVLTVGCTEGEADLEGSHVHLVDELGQRVALAIENARLFRHAEAASRAKTDFLSVMSHELRTPLSAIIGYTDLIDRGVAGETTEKQQQFLTRIRASSNHLLQIIEEILAFASTEAGEAVVELGETTVGTLVQAVAAVVEPLARDSRLEFRLDVHDPEAALRTDARKVRQILINLISNALKFTEEGWVRLDARVDGDHAVFAVQDSGVGIPEDRLEAIFERFRQVEDPMTRRTGGTGLGLTIARSFARILDGHLDVESVVGEGSTFTLTVPRNGRE